MTDNQVVLVASRPGQDLEAFLVRWVPRDEAFDLALMSSTVRLSRSRQLLTAQHVIYGLEVDGYELAGRSFGDLFELDDHIRQTVGDPVIVGDPGTGVVGAASPHRRRVDRQWTLTATGRWTDHAESPGVRRTSASILAVSAPLTFRPLAPTMDPHRQRNVAVAADEFLTAMFPAPPHLGWNVRALQDWALVATDDTETERPAMAAELLARVADVAPGSVAQAAASLRSFTGADRTSVSRASEAGPKTSARRPGPRHPPTGAELAL